MKLSQVLSCVAVLGSVAAAALPDDSSRTQILIPPQQINAPTQHSSSAPSFDDSEVQWENATSTKGNPYMIGFRKNQDDSDRTIAEESWEVYWPISTDWQQALGPVNSDGGIAMYKLLDAKGWVFKYELNISIKENYPQGVYYFCDETKDCYEIRVCNIGDHYVNYNSDKPTVRRVKFEKKIC